MSPFVLSIDTTQKSEMINISDLVSAKVSQLATQFSIKEGVLYLYNPHTTAGLTINEGCDPHVCRDILSDLDRQVPWDGDFLHSEGNSAGHIKASLMGSSVSVLIDQGKLVLGTWQAIFFCEFDGPRKGRKIHGKVIKG